MDSILMCERSISLRSGRYTVPGTRYSRSGGPVERRSTGVVDKQLGVALQPYSPKSRPPQHSTYLVYTATRPIYELLYSAMWGTNVRPY